jgi:RNA polymerase sigma-70 factor, ECF subfamily
MDRARTGDRGAFEELVKATSADIYALAYRLTGNEHDARDIVQETYLRAFRSIRRFRGESSFPTWLYRIASNCSATMHRRRRGATVISMDTDPRVGEVPVDRLHDSIASRAVEHDRLVQAMATLPLTLRSVVVLHDVYDLNHDEIADQLGISGASSRVRLHRARRQLRTVIAPELAAPAPPALSQAASASAASAASPAGAPAEDPVEAGLPGAPVAQVTRLRTPESLHGDARAG